MISPPPPPGWTRTDVSNVARRAYQIARPEYKDVLRPGMREMFDLIDDVVCEVLRASKLSPADFLATTEEACPPK